MAIQGPNLYIFYDTQNLNFFFKKIRNLREKKLKICMPKKMTPKSQAKNKTPFT